MHGIQMSKVMCIFLKNLHFTIGGAICCLLELCILSTLSGSHGKNDAAHSHNEPHKLADEMRYLNEPLRYLEVSFLSPCKGALEVGIEHHELGTHIRNKTYHPSDDNIGMASPIGCVTGKVYSAKDKKKSRLLVEASYSY